MKFLCENCKAKYQVADDKVAGKTVRMKCRKCGHPIEVRATISDTTVVPPPAPAGRAAASLAPNVQTAAGKPPPAAATTSTDALSGAFMNRVQNAPVSATNPGAAPPRDLSSPEQWFVGIEGAPVGPLSVDEFRKKAAQGAITLESLCWREGLEEWRPVGSVPELVTIVRNATRPARPPAHAGIELPVVPKPPPVPTTARLSRTASAAPPPPRPAAAPSPAAPASPAAPTPLTSRRAPAPAAPAAPLTAPAAPVAAPGPASERTEPRVGGMTLAPATLGSTRAELADASPVDREVDPFAIPRDASAVADAAPTPSRPVLLEPSSSLAPEPVGAVVETPTDATAAKGRPPSQRMPLWMWPVLVLALGFGVGLAVLAFRPPPAAPVIVQAPSPPPTPAPAPEPSASSATTEAAEAPRIDLDDPTPRPAAGDSKARLSPATKTVTAKAPEVPEKRGIDLGNLVPGGGGPNVGPGTTSGGATGGSLDQATIERIVAGHRTGVKRTCWERGGVDQKSSVNVTVTTTIAANGAVSSTSSSGDDPVVAKCIENQVRGWRFPASGSPTTINIPFKFVRQ